MGGIIEFRRGTTFDAGYEITVTISDLLVPNLTGFTGAARLRPENAAPIALIFTWINAALRLAAITAGPTGAWPIGGAWLEVQLTSPSGAKIDLPPVTVRITKGFADD